MHYGDYGDAGMGWAGWLVMVTMMVVFWGAIAWVIITLIRSNRVPAGPPGLAGTDAMRVLDERFARGEIDQDDYQQRRAVLREGP